MTPRSRPELEACLPDVRQSPADAGRVEAIVIRPSTGKRELPAACEVSPGRGVHGDRWAAGDYSLEAQITIMNARFAEFIAGGRDNWALAGDNLLADLDLSSANLPPGQRLAVGTAILEVSAKPHTGCAKFLERFGKDSAAFLNTPEGRDLRLRGINCSVVQAGTVRLGDRITKTGP